MNRKKSREVRESCELPRMSFKNRQLQPAGGCVPPLINLAVSFASICVIRGQIPDLE